MDGMKIGEEEWWLLRGALLGMPRLRWDGMVGFGEYCFPACSAEGGALYTVFCQVTPEPSIFRLFTPRDSIS